MTLAQKDMPAHLTQRCCLVCGYSGPELQDGASPERWRCPACDADLYARPARSYAELEGFLDLEGESPARVEVGIRRSMWGRIKGVAIRITAAVRLKHS